jgi:predicted glycoside hydrolase/deacetylase ChbG (UPF0249 family)
VLRILWQIAPEYGIVGIRLPRERVPSLVSLLHRSHARRHILKQFAFGKLISAASVLSRLDTKRSPVTPRRFYGITQTGFLDLAAFADIVKDLDDGVHELMCHPGYVDDDLKKTPTRLHAQRERELELLIGSEVRGLLTQAAVTLISYKDLVEGYGNRKRDPVLHRYSAL